MQTVRSWCADSRTVYTYTLLYTKTIDRKVRILCGGIQGNWGVACCVFHKSRGGGRRRAWWGPSVVPACAVLGCAHRRHPVGAETSETQAGGEGGGGAAVCVHAQLGTRSGLASEWPCVAGQLAYAWAGAPHLAG